MLYSDFFKEEIIYESKNKKILAAISALTLVCGIIPSQPYADVTSSIGITANAVISVSDYDFNAETGTIIHYNGEDEEVEIPSEIGGVAVTTIDRAAFGYNTSLKSVTIPDSVKTIGRNAFSNCSSLEDITLPNSVVSIEDNAFDFCLALENITLPDSVKVIGQMAFAYCRSLETIKIPASIGCINDSAFAECTDLKIVNYRGTENGWKNVEICSGNDCLLNAFIIFTGTEEPPTGPDKVTLYGDANCDDVVDISDVVLLKSWLLNSEKYEVSEQGLTNADVQEIKK